MPEQKEQDDDGNRDAEQPEKNGHFVPPMKGFIEDGLAHAGS
jgi:hypothetical protein